MRAGEALTLHYVENPREVSHATRRRMLWDQHRFDIGDGGDATTARAGRRACDCDDVKGETINIERMSSLHQLAIVPQGSSKKQ